MPKPLFSTPTTINRGSQCGFTLLELLVVIVIVSILFTYTTLAIRTDAPEDLIKQEAHRLERLVQLALEESILRGEEYGIEVFIDGYRFLRFTENEWVPIADDDILRDRELPKNMEMEMQLEETEIVISATSNPMEESTDLESSEDIADEGNKKSVEPHIYLLSSSEITPEFEIRFYITGIETSYLVKGIFDGKLTTEISDL